MIIYLAGGFTVMNNPEVEELLSEKFDSWNRLISFYFITKMKTFTLMDLLKKQKGETIENISCYLA
jgi:hypothetical protein